MFIGRLGRDPEVRYLPSGVAVCNFSIAASERWKDKTSGEMQEKTEWLRCNAFDRLAEVCGEYLKTGALVYVEGKLQTRQYEKDGVTMYATECRVDQMKMLGGKQDREGGGENEATAQQRNRAGSGQQRPAPARAPAPASSRGFDDMDDDIPF